MNSISIKRQNIIFYIIAFILVFMRFVYYGFEYFPQLDDYIQYYSYRQFLGTIPEIIEKLGLLSARPLAGIMDITLWNFFFNTNMIFGVFIISILYTSSAFILKKAFSNIFTVSNIFIFVYLLLPLGFEGTYWVSASSRIVVGMFFASVGIYFFSALCEKGSIKYIPLFMIFQLISFGFYEQVIVFSITATFLIMLSLFFKKGKITLFAFLTFVNVGIFAFVTSYFKNSSLYSSRMEIMFPNSEGYFDVFIPEILSQFKEVIIYGNFYTLFKGFIRGISIIFQEKSILYFVILIILCVFVFKLSKDEEQKGSIWAFVFGILLFIAPLTPFLVIGNPWFSFRGAITSFAGLGIVVDTVFNLCIKNMKIKGIVTSFIIFIFSVAGVSEIHDYRENSIKDENAAKAYIEAVENVDSSYRIGVLNLNEINIENYNYIFHEHITGVTGSDWSFLGCCRYFAKEFDIPTPIPLSVESYVYRPYNSDINNIENFDMLLWYDGEKMNEVFWDKIGEKEYIIYGDNVYGTIYDENGYGLFRWE